MQIIDSIKGVGKAVIDKVPVVIDKVGEIAGKVIDKGEEVAGKLFDKVNPLSHTGFYIALGIGAFVLIELFNSKAGETFASLLYLQRFNVILTKERRVKNRRGCHKCGV